MVIQQVLFFMVTLKMSQVLKKQVLQTFKALHRTRLAVFKGDERTLNAARERINQEFRKNKGVNDESTIKDMVVHAEEVNHELKTTVIQAEQTKPGVYELRVTPDTVKLDNKPFDPDAVIPEEPCCQQMTPCCRTMKPCQQAAKNQIT